VPRLHHQERFSGDLDFRDAVFVYPVTMVKDDVSNEDYEQWAATPIPIQCSVQEHAIDSQDTEPGGIPNRFSRVFTRFKGFVKWHDKLIFRETEMVVIKVLDRFDNYDGTVHHVEIRARFLREGESIDRLLPDYDPFGD
jgi:hypothetical protein